jgi:pimeloyl-ACP methyl ester carboxylesterase
MREYQFTEIDEGSTFHYRLEGDGPALVFLHAGIADLRMWHPQFEALASDFRVLAYDIRGYGKTDAPQADFAHHEDLRMMMDAAGIERAAIVGCSLSGGTAIDFALAYPERVSHLVPVCTLPNGFDFEGEIGEMPPQWEELVAAFKSGDLEKTNELETRYWVIGFGRDGANVDPAVLDLVRKMNGLVLQRDKEQQGKNQPLEPKAIDRLGEIDVPVLVISGEYDEPGLTPGWGKLLPRFKHARQVILPAAHLPNLEYPERFNELLREFVQG